jgi:hypothetical protein
VKISSKKEKVIPRINQAFAKLVNDNGSQTEAADLLKFRSQDIGYYMRGRSIPSDLIKACREKYGYDLIELEEMEFENMVLKKKESFERIVSHEADSSPTFPVDLTLELWEELRSNNKHLYKTYEDVKDDKKELLKQNGQLIEIFHDLSRRGVFPHKS